jgi:hypothetical protein
VHQPTNLYGDNKGVIQSSNLPNGELKKKHVAISYHFARESIAAKVVNSIWIPGTTNFADINTKALGATIFNGHVSELMW